MKYLRIQVSDICNFSCPYCSARDTTIRGVIKSNNLLDLKKLLKWMKEYIDPEECYLCLAGGEPTLHPDFEWFVKALIKEDYCGTIVTNGTKKIFEQNNFLILTTWHPQLLHPPLAYHFINIFNNPDDPKLDWKVEWCKQNKVFWNYGTFINFGSQREYIDRHYFFGKIPVGYGKQRFNTVKQVAICEVDSRIYSCHYCNAVRCYSNTSNRDTVMQDYKKNYVYFENMDPPRWMIPCKDCYISKGGEDMLYLAKEYNDEHGGKLKILDKFIASTDILL